MHLLKTIRALPPFLLLLLLSTLSDAFPSPAQQQRLVDFLTAKPMHTTALLAGAAATPLPAMPTVALRSRVPNREMVMMQHDLVTAESAERDKDALLERLKEVELRELRI